MTTRAVFFLLLCASLTGASNLLLRQGLLGAGGFQFSMNTLYVLSRSTHFISGLLLYGAAAVVWFYIVSFAPLTSAYPILVGMSFFLVTLGALAFFNESLSVQKVLGIGVIFIGILLTARG